MTGHNPLAIIHTPRRGPSRGYQAACTLGCCESRTWFPTEQDALDEATELVERADQWNEHGPGSGQEGRLPALYRAPISTSDIGPIEGHPNTIGGAA